MVTPSIPLDEVRAIAKEAYIYGYPMVDCYRILHTYFVNQVSPEYKATWNKIRNIPRVYTPEDKAVQTPNSDTPYSMAGLDLRAEPIVITVPMINEERYFSVQLIDLYTHNFGYLGSRSTGNGGGNYLIAGPSWKGEAPPGITQVICCETELLLAIFRTQLFKPADLPEVRKVQAGYKIQPLSAMLGNSPPPEAPIISFPEPLSPEIQKDSPQVFNLLNFLLQFCPTQRSESALMARFASLGIGAGKTVDFEGLEPEAKTAVQQGIQDAWASYAGLKAQVDKGEVASGQLFGTREYLKGNYLYRMAAAVLGIFGNSKFEAMYPLYTSDAQGLPLTGANRYVLRFAPGQLPPVNAFWSITMYELPASLLVANPLDRYLLNSSMLSQFMPDADGSIALIIQNESPGAQAEANWLPAPQGPFMMAMRLYWPKEEALSGVWAAPPLLRVG